VRIGADGAGYLERGSYLIRMEYAMAEARSTRDSGKDEQVTFRSGDEVAAATDLGGFWRGKVPAGTPGVIDDIDEMDSSTPVFTVTFTIEQDDLLTPHQTTVTGLSITELTKKELTSE
jgi:hypothetical protein